MAKKAMSYFLSTRFQNFLYTQLKVAKRNCSIGSASAVCKTDIFAEHLRLDCVSEPHALDTAREDLSHVATNLSNTFNLAAYVNNSELLKNLVKLGVDLSKIEKNQKKIEFLLKLNFERDIKPHLFFLKEYVEEGHLGKYLTKNVMILQEDLKNLEVRINYLLWKKFKDNEIQRIVTKNPFWLMFNTTRIDGRLGYFQQKFALNGVEVRALAVRQPRLITYQLHHINMNTFAIKEEFGFNNYEMKALLLNKPKLWMQNQLHLGARFDYIHNKMKIPHKFILEFPEALSARRFRVEQRHQFLEKLGRAQYDPTKENYVSLKSLIEGTDVEFCKNVAKCTVDDFNTFLKTL